MLVPNQQQAAVKHGKGEMGRVEIKTIDVPIPGPGQILCKINYSGLCATDKSFLRDEWGFTEGAMRETALGILGHEGAGVVAAVAEDVKDLWKEGDRVGIKYITSICRKCEFCTNGVDELQCLKQLSSGFTVPGTFQEYCVTDALYATRLPPAVKDEEAGPIMCGGVTAYVGCKRSQVRPGQWIVLIGAGGGVGHLGVQYAKAMGMRVIAVDSGSKKEKLCKDLGAEHYVDITLTADLAAEIMRITTFGAHGVVVATANKEAYATAPYCLRPGGTMVVVGVPADLKIVVGADPTFMIHNRISIVGSITGTLKDVDEALDFVARDIVHPILTHGSLHDINDLCDKMSAGKLMGRAVIKVAG